MPNEYQQYDLMFHRPPAFQREVATAGPDMVATGQNDWKSTLTCKLFRGPGLSLGG